MIGNVGAAQLYKMDQMVDLCVNDPSICWSVHTKHHNHNFYLSNVIQMKKKFKFALAS